MNAFILYMYYIYGHNKSKITTLNSWEVYVLEWNVTWGMYMTHKFKLSFVYEDICITIQWLGPNHSNKIIQTHNHFKRSVSLCYSCMKLTINNHLYITSFKAYNINNKKSIWYSVLTINFCYYLSKNYIQCIGKKILIFKNIRHFVKHFFIFIYTVNTNSFLFKYKLLNHHVIITNTYINSQQHVQIHFM